MSIQFQCPLCAQVHASRLRSRDAEQLSVTMQAFGWILELCPTARVWVRVEESDLAWTEEAHAGVELGGSALV